MAEEKLDPKNWLVNLAPNKAGGSPADRAGAAVADPDEEREEDDEREEGAESDEDDRDDEDGYALAGKSKDGQDDKKPKKPKGFDKAIQPILQKAANERKKEIAAVEARYQGQIGSLQKMIASLQEDVAASRKPAKEKEEEKDELADLDAQIDSLPDDAEAKDVKKLVRSVSAKLRAIAALAKRSGKTEVPKEVIERLDRLEGKTADSEGEREYRDLLDSLDRKFGAANRNAALDAAQKYFEGEGYTEEKPPPPAAVKAVLLMMYERQRNKAAGKPGGNGRAGEELASDRGRGGRGAVRREPAKTTEEALTRIAAMDWSKEPDDKD